MTNEWETSNYPSNIIIGGSSETGNEIRDCGGASEYYDVDSDIWVAGPCSYITISHNHLHATALYDPGSTYYRGFSGVYANGAKDMLIEYNTVHGHNSNSHRSGIAIKADSPRISERIVIRYNHVYDQTEIRQYTVTEGIRVSMDWRQIYVYGNYVHDCQGGINFNQGWLSQDSSNGVDPCEGYCWSNIITDTDTAGIRLGGNGTDNTREVYFLNNTIYRAGIGASDWWDTGIALTLSTAIGVHVENNIICDSRPGAATKYSIAGYGISDYVANNNQYYQSDGSIPQVYEYSNANCIPCAWDSVYNSFSGESDSAGDPLFNDSSTSDFTLSPISPCINNGVNLGDDYDLALDPINTDFTTLPPSVYTLDQDDYGTGWEIGAYVYTGDDPDPTDPPINRANWSVSVDSEETVGEDGAAENSIDGLTATYWCTKWSDGSDPLPHEIQINLGDNYIISGFTYLPRQDYENGRIADYEFYVSSDGINWGTAVATGTFPNTTVEQEVTFDGITGQYVSLIAVTEVNSNPWTTVAELNVLGTLSSDIESPSVPQNLQATTASSSQIDLSWDPSTDNIEVTGYNIYCDGGHLDSTTAPPYSDFDLDPDTTYSYTVSAYDAAGNESDESVSDSATTDSILIDRGEWMVSVDSEETVGEDGEAENSIDGLTATYWCTQWTGGSDPLPHEIQIDLRDNYIISGFRYLPRQDHQNGRIADYEFYVSSDGINWGSPVATGTVNGLFPNTTVEQEVTFGSETGRYVRLVALSEVNGNPWTTVAELNVLGSWSSPGNTPPTITAGPVAVPSTIYESQTSAITVTAEDIDNDALDYVWSATAGTITGTGNSVTYTAPSITADTTVTISITVDDGNGGSDSGSVDVAVLNIEDAPIAQAGWTVWYVDSEETVGDDGEAENSFDGLNSTFWCTQWYDVDPDPACPHEIQIDLGDNYIISGFTYLPRQDGSSNGRIEDYEFYVSSDGTDWDLAATGTFANTGTEKEVLFDENETGSYIKLVAESEVNDNPWTTMAELNVLGIPFE